MSRLIRLTGALLVGGIIALGAGAAGAALPSHGWRIVATVGDATHGELPGFFTAPAADDAFSSWKCVACSVSHRGQNFIEHWNGHSWRQTIPLPVPLNYPRSLIAIGASSASNLWAFSSTRTAGVWNGSRWRLLSLPAWVLRPTRIGEPFGQAAVFAPNDVWVFSIGATSQPTLAAHYFHGSWLKVSLPGAPIQVSSVAPNDIWVVGLLATKPAWLAMHWDGSAWRALTLPKVRIPPGDSAGYSIVATGSRDVWLARQVGVFRHTVSASLLHWNGRWHVIKAPSSIDSFGPMSQDGHGGLWMQAQHGFYPSAHLFLYHYGGGWSRQAIPTRPAATTNLATITWIPGTRSLWAAGALFATSSETGDILKFGP